MTWNQFLSIAQATTESYETIEYALPDSAEGLLLLMVSFAALITLVARTSLRDTRFLRRGWRVVLLIPRLIVLLLIAGIVLNPSRRTQTSRTEPSRVGVLIDTSLSMAYPAASEPLESDDEGQPAKVTAAQETTRLQKVRETLVESELLSRLSATHAVSVYTFDSTLAGPHAVVMDGDVRFADSATPADDGTVNAPAESDQKNEWNQILVAQGGETRLAEALHELTGQMAGRTLSGIVVVSDGQSNAGLDVSVARQRMERSEARVITVGTGSPKPQSNIWVAGVQVPADVHRGDPFDVTVIVQSNGAGSPTGRVELYEQSAGSDGSDRKKVAEQPFAIADDGLPVPLKFSRQLNVPGDYEYVARAVLSGPDTSELTEEDNQRQCAVEVTDRKIKVLVISSGPMREYRFVRNILFRHTGIDSDVWLQTITDDNTAMVSQEATEVLTEFPDTAAALSKYNVIVAFDPDWSRLTADQQGTLNRWIQRDAGGLIVVAGELHTPLLAEKADEMRDVSVLYPVVLNRLLSELRLSQGADESWPVDLTPEGRASEFLRIVDATGNTSTDLWDTFDGIYRSYPVRSARDGAVVLATYSNPRARTQSGAPPFLAMQFYGAGRTFFLGSAETWRLRAISPEGHQRFWTSLIREAGQGSRQRGNPRGLLLLDRTTASPGQPVTIEARLYDPRMEALQADSVPMSIVDSEGRPVSVPDRLRSNAQRTGRYSAVFRPLRPGNYRVSVPIPESSDVLQSMIEVTLSSLESESSEQNVDLLTALVRDTGGSYLPLSECPQRLPALLPDRSELVVVDEQLITLWDRAWLMYLLIGLLGLEWALRRVVRLS